MIAIFPEINTCVAAGDLEKLAVLVRVYFAHEHAKKPRLPLSQLVEDFGISVKYGPIDHFGTLLARDQGGRFQITFLIKEDLPLHERHFLLAHLLGYFLMAVQPKIVSGEFRSAGYQVNLSPLQRYLYLSNQELEAARRESAETCDLFASALLLPKGMLMRARQSLNDLDKVAQFFAVTPSAVERRLAWLGRAGVDAASVRGTARAALQAYKAPTTDSPRQGRSKKPSPTPLAKNEHGQPTPDVAAQDDKARSSLEKIRALARLLDDSVRL